MSSKQRKQYILYNTKTTLPVAIGDIEECAKAAGVKPRTLYKIQSMHRNGSIKSRRWELYALDELLEGSDEDEQLYED